MAITTANVQEILQTDYGPDGIGNLAYEDNPAFAMTRKHRFTGDTYDYPVQYGYASNRSRTPATALGKANTTQYARFKVPTVGDYDAKSIQKKALVEAKDPNTFVELVRNVSDSIVKSLANNAGSDFFNHRGAAIGQIGTGSVVGTPTITLSDPSDITKYAAGMVLAVSLNNGLSGALRAGTVTLQSVDRSAGTLTATGNWTAGIAAAAVGDFIFPAGDFGLGRAGLQDWCPDTTSGLGTAFYNVTRSIDSSRMAGSRQTVTGLPVSQAIRALAAVMGREEGKPDVCWMSWNTINDLVTERDIKLTHVRRGSDGMEATAGFDGVRVVGPNGPIDCYADRSCSDTRLYLAKQDTLMVIHSQSDPVKIVDEDGSMMIRESADFSFDMRGDSYLNFVVKSPRDVGVALF